jgi:hypothetical protein
LAPEEVLPPEPDVMWQRVLDAWVLADAAARRPLVAAAMGLSAALGRVAAQPAPAPSAVPVAPEESAPVLAYSRGPAARRLACWRARAALVSAHLHARVVRAPVSWLSPVAGSAAAAELRPAAAAVKTGAAQERRPYAEHLPQVRSVAASAPASG